MGAGAIEVPTVAADPLWRGFNLLDFFSPNHPPRAFPESDFALMAEWGFNYARLPLSYWFWSRPEVEAWKRIDEAPIRFLDEAIETGRRYGVHVNLNLHRIPGYCINGGEREPRQLFKGREPASEEALEAACHHWRYFAGRYKGIGNEHLSFDLINEPPSVPSAEYARVARALVTAIREVDPTRFIVSDGINVGRTPVLELVDLGVMQSMRGYDPIQVSHYQAGWMPEELRSKWTVPTWPLYAADGSVWDRERMSRELYQPWRDLEARGVKVHVGEWGAFNRTPHRVALAWMEDLLQIWKEAGWGWALWNLRGDFGPLDSRRADVSYESFRGMRLDRAMLELLRRY